MSWSAYSSGSRGDLTLSDGRPGGLSRYKSNGSAGGPSRYKSNGSAGGPSRYSFSKDSGRDSSAVEQGSGSQGVWDSGRRNATPLRLHTDYSQTDQRRVSSSSNNYRGLEPILEDMASPSRYNYQSGPSSGLGDDSFSSRLSSGNNRTPNGRRHSDGDLLELSSPGARYNKRPPGNYNGSKQETGDVRYPRKKSYGGMDTSRDYDAFSDVSGKSRISVGSEESLSSASKLSSRRKSEADGASMGKTSSMTSLVRNDQRRKSSAGVESNASTERRSSIANGIDSSKTPPDRRLSTLTLGGTGPSPFTELEIPLELLETPQSRMRKLMMPIIMFVIVVTLLASLSAAVYFAVVLKDTQDKQIEFLQATLKLSVRESQIKDYSKLTTAQLDDFCRQIDGWFQGSQLHSGYRGCEISALTNVRVEFRLYFLNSSQVEDDIVSVLAAKSQQGSQLIQINGVTMDISKDSRSVTLEVTKKSQDFYGANSEELKKTAPPGDAPTSANAEILQKTATAEPFTSTSSDQPQVVASPLATPPPTTPHSPPATKEPAPVTPTSPLTNPTLPTIYISPPDSPTLETPYITSFTTPPTRETPNSPSTPPPTTTTSNPPSTATSTPTASATAASVAAVNAPATSWTATTAPTTPTPTTTVVPTDLNVLCTNSSNQTTIIAHPSSCTQYVQCEFGQARVRPCAGGLTFSADSNTCVPPDRNSPCLVTPCDNINGGYFPHPSNCSLFIICDHGKPVIQECGYLLVWDPDVKGCLAKTNSSQCDTG